MTSYASKIQNNTYCSDRTEDHTSQFYQLMGSEYSTLYGVFNRLDLGDYATSGDEEDLATMSWTPSVSCSIDKVPSKVALLTADEYILAGGGTGETSNYLVTGYSYWTMSPADFNDNNDSADSYYVDDNGIINNSYVGNSYGVRPVITLKANTTISSGSGTSLSPYIIG